MILDFITLSLTCQPFFCQHYFRKILIIAQGEIILVLFYHIEEGNDATMNYIEQLFSYGPSAFIITLLLFFALIEILKGTKFLVEYFGYESKDTKRFKKLEEKINILEGELTALQTDAANFRQNRINDRKQSLNIQQQLLDKIQGVDEVLEFISNQINSNEEKRKSSERARLKDRIGQAYGHYNKSKQWTKMEKEALEELISEYENAGGENSFVHSVVQKEMYTWTEI